MTDRDVPAFESLRLALDSAWSRAESCEDPAGIVAEFRAAAEAVERIEAQAAQPGLDGDGWLDQGSRLLDAIDDRARAVLDDQQRDDRSTARSIALLRAEARLVRRAVRAICRQQRLDESTLRLIELQDAENLIRSQFVVAGGDPTASFEPTANSAATEASEALISELRSSRLDLLERQSRARLTVAAEVGEINDQTARHAFECYRTLDRLQRDIASRRSEFRGADESRVHDTLNRLENERVRLEVGFFRWVSDVKSPPSLDVLCRVARTFERELDEGRVIGLEPATAAKVERLVHLQRIVTRFVRTMRDLLRRRNLPLPAELERLERTHRRVKNVVSDRILDLRLARIFGARMVRRWDSLVFWLILSVLGLLAIDHYRGPDVPGQIHWTIWVDTAICGVLLLDFFVRTVLSPSPLRYVQRHFLTELLPALPFGLLANLEHLTAIQSVRSIRIIRTLTFLQALRPLIRIGRLFLFVSRAADRLVEQNAWLLNQNIVFFSEAAVDDPTPTLVKRARELESYIGRQSEVLAHQLSAQTKLESARWRLRLVESEARCDGEVLREVAEETRATATPTRTTASSSGVWVGSAEPEPRRLDVEDVIHRLRELDSSQVAEFVGVDFAQQLTDSLRFFRLPVLRKIPVIRFVIGDTGVPDPLLTTARLGRVCGDLLDWAQRTVNWFADLYGTITPSQFLDRLGNQIVKATARPARRLILFGVIVGIAMLLVELTRFEFLDRTANFLIRFLSLPVLVLGLLCAIPLGLGIWFRRIARQAADFYDRIAEAQFLSLTETLKEEWRAEDLRYLAERVVGPEARLERRAHGDIQSAVDGFVARGVGMSDGHGAMIDLSPARFDTALLFYRDFLDGAFFHRNDVKVANLLLGNLTLENVRQNRLRFSKARLKQLERIDIARGKGGVGGAAVWFNGITHSVSQSVARLILEYNRYCIPSDELDASSAIDRERFKRWLDQREVQSRALGRGEAVVPVDMPVDLADGSLAYRSTEFHALHFLSADPRRDECVRRRFGARVLRYLREDRENLIRVIFGTYPMRNLPIERRTFNPYEFYNRHFANGLLYLFPLRGTWYLLKGIKLLVRELVRIVKEVRRPESRTTPRASGHANFQVARRKIHRMRRPIALEALRLRAEFDPEYLGLALPDRPSTIPPTDQFSEDLRALEASEREWEEFRRLKSERQERLRGLARVLRIGNRRGTAIRDRIEAHFAAHPARRGEAYRAIAVAWICDHRHAASRVEAFERLLTLVQQIDEAPPLAPRFPLPRIGRSRVRELVDAVWPILARHDDLRSDDRKKSAFVEALLVRAHEFRGALETLACGDDERIDPACRRLRESGDDVYDLALESILEVGLQPSSFTEQLIAVRAIQALAMLDLTAYERQVEGLGGFFETNETLGNVV